MTNYQIISIVIALVGLLGSGLAAYIKLKTDLAKVQAEITDLRNATDSKADFALVKQGQTETNRQLDQLNKQLNLVVTKLMK